MAEKETQEKTSPEATDESKNTENSEELSIPKDRFDQVNQKKKELESRLKELEEEKQEREKKELEEKESYKELTEKLKSENEQLRLNGIKRDLVQEAITSKELHPRLSKMVQGSSEEEIKQSLEDAKAYHKEVLESFKEEHKATDDAGKGKSEKTEPMSQEEWMKLYDKDPEEADRILRKMNQGG